MIVKLVIGDWSGDGHCQSATVIIDSNFSKLDIEKSYIKGSQIIGFDLIEDVCEEYEDSLIPHEVIVKCKIQGMKLEDFFDEYDEEYNFRDWTDGFAKLYLFIVKLGDPDFRYTETKLETVNIGGYGLFH